ncbi:MAG: hypothetical protein NT079_05450 [Candidatus Omnitrophica bacterium]|nr:hypothetical protein [Candidatus Omnitrophota bacterium]
MLIRNKKGITLATAVVLIVFASVVALSTAVFVTGRSSQSVVNDIAERCMYLARAGLNYAVYQYRNSATLYPTGTTVTLDANNYARVKSSGGGGAASAIIINATNSQLANANKRIQRWTIQNNSASAVTINQVTITWQKTPKTLNSFVINSVTRWSGSIATSPAVFTPTGGNFTIPANTTYSGNTANQVNFNSSISGDAGVTVALRMTDGTNTSTCTIWPVQGGTCTTIGSLSVKSMGKVTSGSNIYRTILGSYNSTTGKVTSCSEVATIVP